MRNFRHKRFWRQNLKIGQRIRFYNWMWNKQETGTITSIKRTDSLFGLEYIVRADQRQHSRDGKRRVVWPENIREKISGRIIIKNQKILAKDAFSLLANTKNLRIIGEVRRASPYAASMMDY